MRPRGQHNRWELHGGRVLLVLTLTALLCLLVFWVASIGSSVASGELGQVVWRVVVGLLSLFLALGSVVYQVARLGYVKRANDHKAASKADLRRLYDSDPPRVAILVPSYKEDCSVVRRTLLSAALQEYPNRRVVLLIDDPPEPSRVSGGRQLLETRRLPFELSDLLAEPAARLRAASQEFERRQTWGALDRGAEARTLVRLFEEVATWFERQASQYECADHADAFFVDKILCRASHRHRATAAELGWHARSKGRFLTAATIEQLYRQLGSIFDVAISSFERKRYDNLSHAPNKAMNLNSYIALLGKHVREQHLPGAVQLIQVDPTVPGSIEIGDVDYVLTLDADSVLLSEYTLRLVHLMEEPASSDVAVAQTPYSAFEGATGVLERVAGATTDIQYLIHQGFTEHSATFWVGANALLRKRALDEIVESEREDGKWIHRYISDRTVIEDTESSVELVDRGWRLINYPERLSFSATPPDFGSLLIQRRRWANGGLLILPKLLRYLASLPLRPQSLVEGLLRTHYLTSIAGANIALLVSLLIPTPNGKAQSALIATAIPYLLLYTRDLKRCGYRGTDVLRICSLNLLLVPVNLAGVFSSLQQAATGQRTPFGRTPKTNGRTATPTSYLIAEFALFGYATACLSISLAGSQWLHAICGAATLALLTYGAVVFLGLKLSARDIRLSLANQRA